MILNTNVDFFIKNVLNLDLYKDIIFIKNKNFKYIYVNNIFCELFYLKLSDIINKQDSDFILDENLLKTCQESDIYVLKNNYLISIEEAFNKKFRVLKLKIDLGNNQFGILGFAKMKED